MKILSNKYFLTLLILVLGIGLGYWLAPDNSASKEAKHAHEGASAQNTTWTCAMHPQIRQSEPGSCPICGMDLIPMDEVSEPGIDPNAIKMSPSARKLANIQTITTGAEQASGSIQLTGTIQANEKLQKTQSAHFAGRLEALDVNFAGEWVTKGQRIGSIYAPELVTAQQELLQAYQLREQQPELFAATKTKLAYWKLDESTIERLLNSGKVMTTVPITAQHSGYVIEMLVATGDYLKTGQPLFTLNSLSNVWILFDVFEKQLPAIQKGQKVKFSTLNGKEYEGTISYIDPVINPKTRVASARTELANPAGQLKPGMLVNGTLEIQRSAAMPLTLPKSAILWTGKRSVVYIQNKTDQGTYFTMRPVILGADIGDSFEILEGIKAGEEVAVNGAFSIDAAAQLAGKYSMMNQPEPNDQSNLEISPFTRSFESPRAFKDQLDDAFRHYLQLKDALVKSDVMLAKKAAGTLLEQTQQIDMSLLKGDAHMVWMKDLEVLITTSSHIATAKNLDNQRKTFQTLSDQWYHTLRKFKSDLQVFRQYCPMAFQNKGAYWLSTEEEIRNPYFGHAMLTCGEVTEQLNKQ